MKYILSILLAFLFFSCNTQEKEIDITGNWYLDANSSVDKLSYLEVYINLDSFYMYQDFMGISQGYGYSQKNGILHLINIINDEKMKIGSIKTIDKNTISFFNDNNTITYKRILDKKVKLEKLATEYNPNFTNEERNAFENNFLEAFYARKKEWAKTHKNKD